MAAPQEPEHHQKQDLKYQKKKTLAVVGPNANRTLTMTANYAGCKNGAGGAILPSCTFVNPLQGLTAQA
eukprot:SAG22_NODE_938_length_6405_cov_3.226134_5_plen_68_part_01